MAYKYATQIGENSAKALMTSQKVSTKQSLEIARFIKGKTTKFAIAYLEDVLAQKVAVPYTKFNWKVGHKPNMAAGRYPVNASKTFISLIKLAIANAEDKGLSTEGLIISSVVVNKGTASYRYGRIRGRKFKNSHLEMVVSVPENKQTTKTKKTQQGVVKPVVKNTEAKPAVVAEAKQETAPKVGVKSESKKLAEKKVETPEAQQ